MRILKIYECPITRAGDLSRQAIGRLQVTSHLGIIYAGNRDNPSFFLASQAVKTKVSLREANRDREHFTYICSHDLKDPARVKTLRVFSYLNWQRKSLKRPAVIKSNQPLLEYIDFFKSLFVGQFSRV